MSAHFLLSAAARSPSVAGKERFSEDEAWEEFKRLRWYDNGGDPVCPWCKCTAIYTYKARRIFKCKACERQFSVTTGTIFASRKLPIHKILHAITLFAIPAKGMSTVEASLRLDIHYKSAFVLMHKLREAVGAEYDTLKVGGGLNIVEIDGMLIGTYVKKSNLKKNRKRTDLRLPKNWSRRRAYIVVARERTGRTLPFVFAMEGEAVSSIIQRVRPDTTIHADDASCWDRLEAHFPMFRINHSEAYSVDDCTTNQAESFHSMMRRAEMGIYHSVSSRLTLTYAREMAWRQDNRRHSTGQRYEIMTRAALNHPQSRKWAKYWQRRPADFRGVSARWGDVTEFLAHGRDPSVSISPTNPLRRFAKPSHQPIESHATTSSNGASTRTLRPPGSQSIVASPHQSPSATRLTA